MNVVKRIWERVKEYKASIIIYFIMFAVGIGADLIMLGFNLPKYIAYAVLVVIFTALRIIQSQNKKYIIKNSQLLFSKEDTAIILIFDIFINVNIITDIIFIEFNIFKYIIYALLLIILIVFLYIKYKEQIKDSIEYHDCIETDIDNKIN